MRELNKLDFDTFMAHRYQSFHVDMTISYTNSSGILINQLAKGSSFVISHEDDSFQGIRWTVYGTYKGDTNIPLFDYSEKFMAESALKQLNAKITKRKTFSSEQIRKSMDSFLCIDLLDEVDTFKFNGDLKYDGFEVDAVVHFINESGEVICEPINCLSELGKTINQDDFEGLEWTLFAHLAAGGRDTVCNFKKRSEAFSAEKTLNEVLGGN